MMSAMSLFSGRFVRRRRLSARSFAGALAWLICIASTVGAATQINPHLRLKVSSNQRYLVYADGRPFFYLGDTAWELFHRLTREEADRYLENRAAKGFTVIQAVVLAELDGLRAPNANGDLPFVNNDLQQPNPAYFRHVDAIVEKAASLGLFVGMLPSWGDKVGAYGNYFINQDNARGYGRFLGERYKDKPIIWILGGDRMADTTAEIWTELARGLKQGDGGRGLMTFHPTGGRHSSTWFHNSDWLDFNMIQSGHNPASQNYYNIQLDYNRLPPKPCFDGEPAYEYPPNDMPAHRAIGEAQVRSRAYWALFSGAHGHTYGTHSIWQMYAPPRTPLWDVHTPWSEAMNLPGANQLSHLKALLFSRPFLTRVPDQTTVYSKPEHGPSYATVTRDGTRGRNDASYLMVYFPTHKKIELKTERLSGNKIRAWWFNPRDGAVQNLGELEKRARMEFEPPATSATEDWVLVLDDAAKKYPPPGVPIEQSRDRH
jgi:hypothetical protein